MDMFLSGLSNLNDAQSVDTVTEAESSKARSTEVRVSGNLFHPRF